MDKDPPAHSIADLVLRVQHAIEANETTRIVLNDGLATLATALDQHHRHIDAHLRVLMEDLKRRDTH